MTQALQDGIRGDGWQAEHARKYIETNGEDGHLWRDVTTLLLCTNGSKTGQPFTTPLIYGRDGDRFLIVASKGGSDTHPQWYRNLQKNPEVELQVGSENFMARARTATKEEKPRVWQTMAQIWPAYNEYQTNTKREIPVVILERI